MQDRPIITYKEFQQECKEYLSNLFGISDIISQREFLKFDTSVGFRHAPFHQCKICVNGFLYVITCKIVWEPEPYMWECALVNEDDLVIKARWGNTITQACNKMLKQIKKENENDK